MRRFRLLFFSVCWLSLWPLCSAQTLKQDLAFKQWGQLYFPFEDWRWWKAQGTAESALNQSARSWCGAIGVMQLMPQTAKELHINPFDEQANIQGGVHYDRQLWDMWNGIPSAADRRRYMFGSYNAGIATSEKPGAWPARADGKRRQRNSPA